MNRLVFAFEENDHFKNKELQKTYFMADEDALEPMLEKAEGCEIEWASGKNPCVKILKKKSKKTGKMMTKSEPQPSFFRFFSPPEVRAALNVFGSEGICNPVSLYLWQVPEEEPEDEEEAERLGEILEEDYSIGLFIKEKIIPHAIDWYTGSAIENDFDDDNDDEDDEVDFTKKMPENTQHSLLRLELSQDDEDDNEDDENNDDEEVSSQSHRYVNQSHL